MAVHWEAFKLKMLPSLSLRRISMGCGLFERVKLHEIDCDTDPTGAGIAFTPTSEKVSPDKPQPKVVIVGAGLAGLTAAHKLREAGLKDVFVFEASKRPGGRICSAVLPNGSLADLGAQWVQGAGPANPVTMLASQADSNMDCRHDWPVFFYSSNGDSMNQFVSMAGYSLFSQVLSELQSLYVTPSKAGYGTVKDYILTRLHTELDHLPASWRQFREDLINIINGRLVNLMSRWGASTDMMQTESFGSFLELPGPLMRVDSGNVSLIKPLLKGLAWDTVEYSKPVKHVFWSDAITGVQLESGPVVRSHFVIVTVPLGVLKESHKELFDPTLPAKKAKAINRLGVGHISKVFLEYQHPFWKPGEGMLRFAWSEDDLMSSSWVKSVPGLEEMPGCKRTLMFSVGGKDALELESVDEDDVAEEITPILRKFTGVKSLPYPKHVAKTKWSSNKFFRGAVTYLPTQANADDICILQEGIPPGPRPRVIFAGEATAPGAFSTLQGARSTGLKAADKIISLAQLADADEFEQLC